MEVQSIQLLSVVIPVFNESASLNELLQRLRQVLATLSCDYEIIFVDDGSHDNSAQLLRNFAQIADSKIRVVLLNRNYGQHAAIMAGFEQCGGDLVITLDADLQNPPEEIPRLVAKAEEGYDVVATMRMNRQDNFLRRLASRLVNRAARQATGVSMTDYGCMLRAYRRRIVQAMLSCHERSTFIPILANSFARTTTEIAVTHAEREHGKSRYDFMKLINLMFDLVTSMTTAPLRLLSIVGSVIALSGFLFAAILIILRILLGANWAGEGVFTILAILFVFVGAQFLGLGLLGEYIGRIYADVRARPRYFVEEIVGANLSQVTTSSDK